MPRVHLWITAAQAPLLGTDAHKEPSRAYGRGRTLRHLGDGSRDARLKVRPYVTDLEAGYLT
jgi:hypothetical protein